MLLLLILLPVVFSKDTPVDSNFVIKRIDSCPEEGYLFRRELSPNSAIPAPCYLCFCQNDGTATCWRRENRRCDVESYHYHNVGKRDTRARRGIGLGDIFLRDAARDFFNKQLPEQCKPYESSFSDGCPPADWCIGCTVCDCDANGHWDCHVLSYCPNKSTKKPYIKSRKGLNRRTIIRKSAKRSIKSPTKNTSKPKPPMPSKSNRNPPKSVINKPTNKNRPKRQPVKNHNQQNNKKIIQRKNQHSRKIVKKYISKKPVTPRTASTKRILLPTSPKLAQVAVREIMAAVQKMMRNDLKKGNSSRILQAVDKKHLAKVDNNKKGGTQNNKQNKNTTKKFTAPKTKARNKREANLDVENIFEVNSTVFLPKESSFVEEDAVEKRPNNATFLPSIATTPSVFKIVANRNLSVGPIATIITRFTTNTTTPITTDLEGFYYKYIENSNTTLSATNQPTTNTFPKKVNLTTTQNATTAKNTNFIINITDVNEEKNDKDRMIYLIDKIPSGNDLKFKKWSKIKVLKDKAKHFKVELVKSKNLYHIFGKKETKVATFPTDNKKISVKHQVKKMSVPKKYTVKKLVNKLNIRKDENTVINKTSIFYVNNKITQLQAFVKNLLSGFSKNNTNKTNKKSKQFNILRYMRKFFRKIFLNTQKKLPNKGRDLFINNRIIETLCENFGPCKINKKQKKLLEMKMKDIHRETAKILRTINIIKGLLHLIELHSNKDVSSNKTKSSFKDDMVKLNSILKNTYEKPFSETDFIQIEYIKNNTQEFIQSIGNFATLLNEIIVILNTTKDNSIYPQTVVFTSIEKKSNKNEAFTLIKALLMKYDIIHNTFLKRMYDAISNFESKLKQEKVAKVNMKEELGNIASINHFSNNIITNLRKLTHLAQTLNSKKQKREVTKDVDAIEYLLMLMEYLLKQNHPLDVAPVNDGIDLLLESIQHSPDLKSIKKKVLENLPLRIIATTMPGTVNNFEQSYLNITSSENDSKSESNNTLKLDDTKLIDEVEEDRDYDDKYVIRKKSTDIITLDRRNVQSSTIQDDRNSTTHKEVIENKNTNKGEFNKTAFDWIVERFDDTVNNTKYEIYNADLDDENQVTETTTTEFNIEADTSTLAPKVKDERDISESEFTKLDWVDTEAKDYKEYKSLIHYKSTTSSTTKAITTNKGTEDNVSIISRESKTDRKKKKINTKKVLLKKQMDLLNSLDYGTEKTNTEESESKDSGTDDRYTVDTFPAYFL